ncbi:MAG: hypothetical protein RRA15_13175 [bacterium]|nr:hypothetical protein [bacterium]MDT8367412.1 hypothetical protein [bacterium]
MRIHVVMIALLVVFLSAGIAYSASENFGGNGKGWTAESSFGVDYYQHKNTETHTKNFNSSQGAGKRFSLPGQAEGKASGNSVILNDPMHPGTQLLPGSKRD